MPQTALTVTILKQNNYAVQPGDLAVTLTASDNVNGNSFPCTGNEILLVQNTDTVAHTFTVSSVADAFGRTGDLAAYSVPASSVVAIQESLVSGWRQADGNIYMSSTSALLKFAVLRAL